MSKDNIFRGGVSTRPEVDALMKLTLKAGDIITYAQVEEITGVNQTTTRFRTVTNAWRRRMMRECRLYLDVYNQKFFVLTPDESVDEGGRKLRRAGRAAGRAAAFVYMIHSHDLSENKMPQYILLKRHSILLREAAKEACAAVSLPPKTKVDTVRLVAQ